MLMGSDIRRATVGDLRAAIAGLPDEATLNVVKEHDSENVWAAIAIYVDPADAHGSGGVTVVAEHLSIIDG